MLSQVQETMRRVPSIVSLGAVLAQQVVQQGGCVHEALLQPSQPLLLQPSLKEGELGLAQPGGGRLSNEALVAHIEMKEPPVRLVLGADALHRARARLSWIRHELDAHESLSRATDFDGSRPGPDVAPFERPRFARR